MAAQLEHTPYRQLGTFAADRPVRAGTSRGSCRSAAAHCRQAHEGGACHEPRSCTSAASAAPGPRWWSGCSAPQPDWVNVGELVDLARSVARTDELCGCGEPFSRCPVWTRVGEAAFGGWTTDVLDRLARVQRSAARQRHLPGLLAPRRPASGALVELRNAYAAVYRAVAEVTGSTRRRRCLQGSGARRRAGRGPRRGPAHAQRRPRPAGRGMVVAPPRRPSARHVRNRARCGGSRCTGPRRSGVRSSSRWRRSRTRAECRSPGSATRTWWPTRCGPSSPRRQPLGRSAGSCRPAGGRRRGGAGAQPRTVRQPRTIPLRAGAVAARRPLGHRDACVVPRARHGAHAASAAHVPISARHPHHRSGGPAGRTSILEQLMTHPRPIAARRPAAQEPLVSVVIPTRGRPALLEATLASDHRPGLRRADGGHRRPRP